MAYYMWRQQLKQPVAISEASFTVGELSLVSVEVSRSCFNVSGLLLLSETIHLHPKNCQLCLLDEQSLTCISIGLSKLMCESGGQQYNCNLGIAS